jgi:hypothetical protein
VCLGRLVARASCIQPGQIATRTVESASDCVRGCMAGSHRAGCDRWHHRGGAGATKRPLWRGSRTASRLPLPETMTKKVSGHDVATEAPECHAMEVRSMAVAAGISQFRRPTARTRPSAAANRNGARLPPP